MKAREINDVGNKRKIGATLTRKAERSISSRLRAGESLAILLEGENARYPETASGSGRLGCHAAVSPSPESE